MLVCDDNGVSRAVCLLHCWEAIQERPEKGSEVVEDQASRMLLFFNYGKESLQRVGRWRSAVSEVTKSVLSNRFDESFTALKPTHEFGVDVRKSPLASSAAANVDLHREAKRSAIGGDSVPKKAVVIGDVDMLTRSRPKLAGCLPFELGSGLVRERE